MQLAAIETPRQTRAKQAPKPTVTTLNEHLENQYGPAETASRRTFEGKAAAFYLCGLVFDLRTAAGLTQQQLADKIGVKRAYLSRVERGDADVQLSTFARILAGLDYKLAISPQPNLAPSVGQMTDK